MTKDDKREAIIQAASKQFSQYGYRKTAMDDISKRMGISRASLYSYFDNKDEIFRNVSLSIHERALSRAQEHLLGGSSGAESIRSLADRVGNALLARHSPFQKAVAESHHGDELFDEYSRLCGDIVHDSHARFQALLASALNAASGSGDIDLKKAGITGKAAAEILNLGAAGLKRGAPDLAIFRKRIKNFTKAFIVGLGG
ncbi:TetR/AcrR family transcriptional regulator [Pseudomonadales bacterium]|jgi:AcrR family transcriptional regulator|nr:TetR/AcrR family transcriptional regulator [Gammaproteobacteria bacterium]MBT3733684.1 TetR/AcrR family transcriptional regulator [Gammaproteobacteria bacterium]MBT7539259.1 TetR/AcrR family transcriptional regulator [Gammaproteobacteria bacterium]MDC1478144.1 TetR/AcrR family transcriptional regulator [Pseudomonadales bacterium]